ncbi:TerD family protein [Cardiobacterium valvarum]|uniref:General stress protein 16U n=2 Tax=Cardiobacterium valvarum TaxID=194702 RepID=A0A381EEZ2_9GAMM|nr:TerD family protein [Cardiobacterium valvarum]EHM55994.1 bacterial stress protein [Cardiobacterium valvarum F0432]SUX25604.1 General stress protein 16U [Cardiobacterium valvarum]
MAVNLQKGQKISLEKEAGGTLTSVVMGLGWDVAKKKGLFGFGREQSIDLDASCFVFDDNNNPLDLVYFGQLASRDGSIQHSGDNRTGEGDGDDEQIAVALNRIPANIKTLVFTVSNYTGQNFSQVENAYCRLVDGQTGKEIARYNLSAQGNHTAQIMAKLYRHNGEWKMHAIGENSQGATPDLILPKIVPYL